MRLARNQPDCFQGQNLMLFLKKKQMNENEIKEFLKQSNEKRRLKESVDDVMKQFKESDFNPNLKHVAFCSKEQGIVWLHSDRKCDCSVCGIAAENYRVCSGKKVFACTSCSIQIKE